MIDGLYQVEVDTPLGRKTGTAELTTRDGVLELVVNAPIVGKQVAHGSVEGNRFSVSGKARVFLLGEFDCVIEGKVDDDLLTATLNTNAGNFIIAGARL